MYKIIATDGSAKAAELTTPHGTILTPVFMNVGTQAAIKGAVSAVDLAGIKCQVELSNTYHLHVRPGDELIRDMGGLHVFMGWDKPILTDSGGFQVFSLAGLRKITEEGVLFASHVDGRRIFMGPEESMRVQANLGSDIAMAFDECAPALADYDYIKKSVERTSRWLRRSKEAHDLYKENEEAVNKGQMFFGINQGAVHHDLRSAHAKEITAMGLDGYAIGGLAVGESHEEMYNVLETVVPLLPADKPVYLMGVGTPANIVEAVYRGVDFFDCVLPARNGRHANVYTMSGKLNLLNRQYERDSRPIEDGCGCPACTSFSRAYIRHLFKAGELLALRLCVLHNLFFYNSMMECIRQAIINGTFLSYRERILDAYAK